MMNPAKLLQFKKTWDAFEERHPRFVLFLQALTQRQLEEGTVIEVNVTSPDGTTMGSNLRLTQEDLEMLKDLGSFGKEFSK